MRAPIALTFEHEVAAPLATAFAFHEDPANLVRLLDAEQGFRLLHHDGGNRPGSETWFEVTIAGCVPAVLGFKHTLYEPPHRFAESIVHGPFVSFEHRHEFVPTAAGTLVKDAIDVMLPWYYGGPAVTRLYVAPMIRRMFRHRHQNLTRIVDWSTDPNSAPRATP